jgi:Tfp pilus assembly protein PilN
MKRMNLLPPELRPRDSSRAGSSYVLVGVLAFAIVGMLAYGFVIRGVRSDESELASLKEETAQAQARTAALSPYAAFSEMKQTRARSVRSVAETRFDYERLTRELARILPSGVSVSHLEVGPGSLTEQQASQGADNPEAISDEGAPRLVLNGCAPTQDAVADTLDRLRALTGATSVSLGSSGSSGSDTSAGGGNDQPYLVEGAGGGGSGGCGKVSFDATVELEPATALAPTEAGS